MTLNPNNTDNRRNQRGTMRTFATGTVTSAPEHVSGDKVKHHVQVSPNFTNQSYPAEVPITQNGDITVPTEGQDVFLIMRPDERMVVAGVRYERGDTIPEYVPGLRRIGHSPTDSHIELRPDGTVYIENDAGTTLELQTDGDVVINDGTNNPVTDVSVSTDADGHVTSVSTTKSSNIYIP